MALAGLWLDSNAIHTIENISHLKCETDPNPNPTTCEKVVDPTTCDLRSMTSKPDLERPRIVSKSSKVECKMPQRNAVNFARCPPVPMSGMGTE